MNITEEQKRPIMIGLVAFVVGLALGLLYAWVISPVEWIDQPMTFLRADLQEEYLRSAIDSYRVNADEGLAYKRYMDIGPSAPQLFARVDANPGSLDPGAVAQFKQMLTKRNALTALPTATPGTAPASGGFSWGSIILIVIVLVVVGAVAAAAFWLFRSNRRAPEDMTPAQLAAEHSRAVEKTDYAATGEVPPVAQYVTTYMLGDDLFDDSFSIDSPSGEFLGECGVGISETIGVGDPKKVTAFEVWMFDKNDIQTVTKVLMSPHAFTDPVFRNKLEPKGELVSVEPHKQVVLETQTLQMIATVADMQFGQGALPNSSYFDRVTLELAIWSKK
jgi:hypothetical protein